MTIAAPALAQTAPATTAPSQPAPAPAPAPMTDTTMAPATPAAPDAAAAPAAQPAPAATTAAAPAKAPDQVAQAVARDFPTYDADKNGTLDKTEFGAWMTALRLAAEPGFQAQSPEAATWLGQAFAQADTDKNMTISQGELTVFLTPKQG